MITCPDIQQPCGDGCMKAGYAYVPRQSVNRFYDYESALLCGTMFPGPGPAQGQIWAERRFPREQKEVER